MGSFLPETGELHIDRELVTILSVNRSFKERINVATAGIAVGSFRACNPLHHTQMIYSLNWLNISK
jgi:hypothetical protein